MEGAGEERENFVLVAPQGVSLFQNATYLQEKAGQLIKRRYSGR